MRPIKCGLVGDGDSGKTCISIGFTSDVFFDDYIPTVFDNFGKNLVIDDIPIGMISHYLFYATILNRSFKDCL